MQVALQSGNNELTRLIEAAENGEDVVVTRAGCPVARLVLVRSPSPRGPRILGQGAGMVSLPSDEEWRRMDKEIESLMCDAPLTTGEEV